MIMDMELSNVNVILCDIEGTTTSISFVKEILFPYSTNHLKEFLQANLQSEEVLKILNEIISLPDAKNDNLQIDNLEALIKFIHHLISIDSKVGPLKCLQGLIWEKGFNHGRINGHVFDEVPGAFDLWTKSGIKIYIYSSGSVAAQKLLFTHTEYGNLLKYISGHFDTRIGHKQEPKSYENILKELKHNANEVIFLTDIYKEAEAASQVSIRSILLERPGNGILTEKERSEFTVIKSFNEIKIKT